MADTETTPAESKAADSELPSQDKKKKRGPKPKEKSDKPKPKRSNLDTPPIHDMIVEALETLKERRGVTLHAIKRYLEENYKVDASKLSARIRRALLHGIDEGHIIRTRGHGAMGRFKVKTTKPSMIKKRQAPEDYVELPMVNRQSRPANKRAPKKVDSSPVDTSSPKQKPTKPSKAEVTPKKGPKPKKGRPARKK
ncbi:histone H1B-like [Wyeomyia smithii]|uniref:histone H1B-like n=1 Tax=Wyeomyia smithii TaxID=174621 RepID=UPI002467BA10|nr:histone H1B-like [Wyeomyia smithii]